MLVSWRPYAEATFGVFVHGLDNLTPDGPRIDVVFADYAMRLAKLGTRLSNGPLRDSKILVLTPNDREADIRRARCTAAKRGIRTGLPDVSAAPLQAHQLRGSWRAARAFALGPAGGHGSPSGQRRRRNLLIRRWGR